MAINAYTGLPGSGKSYGVIEHVIVPALKKGRVVWTNIPINEAAMAAYAGCLPHVFHIDDLRNNVDWFQQVFPKGAVLVLDEAWRLWPSGLKANNIAEQHKSFLAEHRHMVGDDGFSTEIYLVTQDLAQIAAFARQLVDSTYRAHKLSAIGASKKFRVDIYDGPVTGAKPPKDKRIREIYGSYKAEIYSLYKSHTMSDTGAAGDETSSDGRKNIFKGFAAKAVLAIIVLGTVFSIWGLARVRSSYQPQPSGAVQPGAPVKPAQVAPVDHGFLGGKRIVIANNRMDEAGIHFAFRIGNGDAYSVLSAEIVEQLGYQVTAMDQCLAVISGHGMTVYAQCHRDREREGLNLVSATADAAKAD